MLYIGAWIRGLELFDCNSAELLLRFKGCKGLRALRAVCIWPLQPFGPYCLYRAVAVPKVTFVHRCPLKITGT